MGKWLYESIVAISVQYNINKTGSTWRVDRYNNIIIVYRYIGSILGQLFKY